MSLSDEHTSWHYFFFFFCLMIFKFFVLILDSHRFQAFVPHQQAELHNSWYTSFATQLFSQILLFGVFWNIFSDLAPGSGSPSRQSQHLFIMNSRGLSTWWSLPKNCQICSPFSSNILVFQQFQAGQAALWKLLWDFMAVNNDDIDENSLCQPILDIIRHWLPVPKQPQNSCPATKSRTGSRFVLVKISSVLENY